MAFFHESAKLVISLVLALLAIEKVILFETLPAIIGLAELCHVATAADTHVKVCFSTMSASGHLINFLQDFFYSVQLPLAELNFTLILFEVLLFLDPSCLGSLKYCLDSLGYCFQGSVV